MPQWHCQKGLLSLLCPLYSSAKVPKCASSRIFIPSFFSFLWCYHRVDGILVCSVFIGFTFLQHCKMNTIISSICHTLHNSVTVSHCSGLLDIDIARFSFLWCIFQYLIWCLVLDKLQQNTLLFWSKSFCDGIWTILMPKCRMTLTANELEWCTRQQMKRYFLTAGKFKLQSACHDCLREG